MAAVLSWNDFWDTFRLSILISLLGALIGHYSKNGVIQFPLFVIPYERSGWFSRCLEYPLKRGNLFKRIVVSMLLGPLDILLFILGFRGDTYGSRRVYLELGLMGDILIGAGTGVLAKTAVEMAGTQNLYAEVSAAFIAGFAGLSYIRERQRKDLGMEQLLDPSSVVEPVPVTNQSHKQVQHSIQNQNQVHSEVQAHTETLPQVKPQAEREIHPNDAGD